MSEATPAPSAEEQARQAAWTAVKDDLSDAYTYGTSVEDKASVWVITFLPRGRVRGGGAEVEVDKASRTVTEIRFLQ